MVTEVTGVTVFTCDEENDKGLTKQREEEKIAVSGSKGVFSSFDKPSVSGIAQKEKEEDNSGGRALSSSSQSTFESNCTVQKNRDLRDSRDPAAQSKPLFVYWHDNSGDCSSCTKKTEYKVLTPQGDVLSKCTSCFDALKRTFAGAEWREHHD